MNMEELKDGIKVVFERLGQIEAKKPETWDEMTVAMEKTVDCMNELKNLCLKAKEAGLDFNEVTL